MPWPQLAYPPATNCLVTPAIPLFLHSITHGALGASPPRTRPAQVPEFVTAGGHTSPWLIGLPHPCTGVSVRACPLLFHAWLLWLWLLLGPLDALTTLVPSPGRAGSGDEALTAPSAIAVGGIAHDMLFVGSGQDALPWIAVVDTLNGTPGAYRPVAVTAIQ